LSLQTCGGQENGDEAESFPHGDYVDQS
jgi:hypothetical protein